MKEKQKKRKAYEPKLTPEGTLEFLKSIGMLLLQSSYRFKNVFSSQNRNDGLFDIQEVLGKCGQHFRKLGGCGLHVVKYVTFSGRAVVLISLPLKPTCSVLLVWLVMSEHERVGVFIYQKSCVPLADADDDEIPQELLLGKHQLSELGSESAKIKAMGITYRVRCFLASGQLATGDTPVTVRLVTGINCNSATQFPSYKC